MTLAVAIFRRVLHLLVVIVLVAVGSFTLVRYAPGYLSDAREMDVRYAQTARSELAEEAQRTASLPRLLLTELKGLARGDLGVSRQYAVPVKELIAPHIASTAKLLVESIGLSWVLAAGAAMLITARRQPSVFWQMPIALLLAIPAAAMVTICLLIDSGGPLLVMTLLLAARDFKYIERLLKEGWRAPHLLQARAHGLPTARLLWTHIVPGILPQISALTTLSIVTALSAVVPVEVIFSVPGLGHTAWNAAMNRDLPVLFIVTMCMAVAVASAGMAADKTAAWRDS